MFCFFSFLPVVRFKMSPEAASRWHVFLVLTALELHAQLLLQGRLQIQNIDCMLI